MLPSAAPAPTIRCSSSIKMIVFLSPSSSAMTFLSRSSNSPRYLVPAIMPARSKVIIRLSSRLSGTSSLTIRWAIPSTMAVLPTPGSPISTGLFLVRRFKIVITRLIWASRPTTGSSLPLRASSVISVPKNSNVDFLPFLPRRRLVPITRSSSSYCWRFKNCSTSPLRRSMSTLMSRSSVVARAFFWLKILYRICSVPQ